MAVTVGISCPTRTTSPAPGREPFEGLADVLRLEGRIGTTGDRDAVLAGGVDQDQGDTRGGIGERPELGNSTPSASSAARASVPNASDPTAPTNEVARSEPGGRDGLVAALAAVVLREPTTGHGLAGRGQALDGRDEVDVDRADNDHPPGHGTLNADPPRNSPKTEATRR